MKKKDILKKHNDVLAEQALFFTISRDLKSLELKIKTYCNDNDLELYDNSMMNPNGITDIMRLVSYHSDELKKLGKDLQKHVERYLIESNNVKDT